MNCSICEKYQKQPRPQPIAELNGISLIHLALSDDGFAMRGRLVIEPARHVENPEDLTQEEFASMSALLQKAMIHLKKVVGAEHVYFFRINDQVKHFHFHLVPRYAETPKAYWGLRILDWPDYPRINAASLEKLSGQIRNSL
jgi:histidine triad (HIT) family protein